MSRFEENVTEQCTDKSLCESCINYTFDVEYHQIIAVIGGTEKRNYYSTNNGCVFTLHFNEPYKREKMIVTKCRHWKEGG
jgi:hypothetical protein